MDARELRLMLALANPFKEGDLLVGGTRDDTVREHARRALRSTTVAEIQRTVLVEDHITDAIARSLDRRLQAELDPLTVEQLTHRLLASDALHWVRHYRDGLTSEAIAAATKAMTNDELSRVACASFNPLPGEGVTVGSPRHFGSRIQPNSPGDEDDEILFSILEGLAYGCGDVIIGLNPASDELETIVRLEDLLRQVVRRLELPTRYCVLSDLPKQYASRARTALDVGFQSLAGTSKALVGMVGLDVDGVLDLARSFDGLYFETGQGSAVTNGTAEGVDMVTLEARAYGVARYIGQQTGAWMIVNDVAGFIGPEVFRTPDQLERACLEDVVMAKLHGLTMGLDVCATFHMGIEPATLRSLTEQIVERAAPAYLMAVAGNADPMLGYLTTSFREHPQLRRRVRRQLTSAMQQRLAALGVSPPRGDMTSTIESTSRLYAAFARAAGDRRTQASLVAEGRRTLQELRERGYELGWNDHQPSLAADAASVGSASSDHAASRAADARVDAIYAHARLALYATLNEAVLSDAAPRHVLVRTIAVDRDDYLAHPSRGEQLRREDTAIVARLEALRHTPHVQIVISDGLNAHAINEHLRALLPALRRRLQQGGVHLGEIDVVIQNGRVRAGYHVGELIGADAIVHLIGERPGSGINTVSAYLTYGRDATGRLRWSPYLDHSSTTAVCGIHHRGKPPDVAVDEIARVVDRMLETGRSGVSLPPAP
jgi:ethanolamine ammonia-lyase large subunit